MSQNTSLNGIFAQKGVPHRIKLFLGFLCFLKMPLKRLFRPNYLKSTLPDTFFKYNLNYQASTKQIKKTKKAWLGEQLLKCGLCFLILQAQLRICLLLIYLFSCVLPSVCTNELWSLHALSQMTNRLPTSILWRVFEFHVIHKHSV